MNITISFSNQKYSKFSTSTIYWLTERLEGKAGISQRKLLRAKSKNDVLLATISILEAQIFLTRCLPQTNQNADEFHQVAILFHQHSFNPDARLFHFRTILIAWRRKIHFDNRWIRPWWLSNYLFDLSCLSRKSPSLSTSRRKRPRCTHQKINVVLEGRKRRVWTIAGYSSLLVLAEWVSRERRFSAATWWRKIPSLF